MNPYYTHTHTHTQKARKLPQQIIFQLPHFANKVFHNLHEVSIINSPRCSKLLGQAKSKFQNLILLSMESYKFIKKKKMLSSIGTYKNFQMTSRAILTGFCRQEAQGYPLQSKRLHCMHPLGLI